jgi:hypothetical protein
MSTAGAELHVFAYGEDLDSLSQRSLGFRLLSPTEPLPWRAEVEALAHQLQASPYPEHWPASDLFCSVLLADGSRLVALARYGLADHTPNPRRGGLELIGVVAPAVLEVRQARAIYGWLKQRRACTDDPHALRGTVALTEILATATALPAPADPTPVLPVRVWQGGALLFAATTPSDPDHRLGLLEQEAGTAWQWLPLVGADFPLTTYAQRGPLVAWTPHLAGVAVKLEPKPEIAPRRLTPPRVLVNRFGLLLLVLLAVLTGANLLLTLSVRQQLSTAQAAPASNGSAEIPTASRHEPAPVHPTPDDSRERFAEALHDLLVERGGRRELNEGQAALLAQYDRLVREHKELRLKDGNTKGRVAVAAVNVLSQRSADRVEEAVKKALGDKGFHPNVVKTACEFVHEQLSNDLKEGH